MESKDFFESKTFKAIIIGTGGLVVLVMVFKLGVFVGTKKADFSFKWAESYHDNFAGPKEGFLGVFINPEKEFTNGSGCFGRIIKIEGGNLTVEGMDNVEKNILVNEKTTIVFQRKKIKLSDLKIDDTIVIIGKANDSGQIEAGLIRVVPAPPTSFLPPREKIIIREF